MNPEFEISYEFRSRSIRDEINQILNDHFDSLGPIDEYTEQIPIEISRTYAQFVVGVMQEFSQPRRYGNDDTYWQTVQTVFLRMQEAGEQQEPHLSLTAYQIRVLAREVFLMLQWMGYGLPPRRYPAEEIERLIQGATATQNIMYLMMERDGEDRTEWESWTHNYHRVIEAISTRLSE